MTKKRNRKVGSKVQKSKRYKKVDPATQKLKQRVWRVAIATAIGMIAIVAYFNLKDDVIERIAAHKYHVKGIDLSHHNPIPNWGTVKEQNIAFAYLKATEGISHKDRNYPFNYTRAKDVNLKVGSYHFYSFALSGREQALHFIRNAQCKSGDLIPAIDVEHSKANRNSTDASYVTSVINELKVLENELYEYYGIHPLIYTNKHCYEMYIQTHFTDNMIWLCNLDGEPSDDINWRIWQYTHKGHLTGMPENIDMNYYRYSFEGLKELIIP